MKSKLWRFTYYGKSGQSLPRYSDKRVKFAALILAPSRTLAYLQFGRQRTFDGSWIGKVTVWRVPDARVDSVLAQYGVTMEELSAKPFHTTRGPTQWLNNPR